MGDRSPGCRRGDGGQRTGSRRGLAGLSHGTVALLCGRGGKTQSDQLHGLAHVTGDADG